MCKYSSPRCKSWSSRFIEIRFSASNWNVGTSQCWDAVPERSCCLKQIVYKFNRGHGGVRIHQFTVFSLGSRAYISTWVFLPRAQSLIGPSVKTRFHDNSTMLSIQPCLGEGTTSHVFQVHLQVIVGPMAAVVWNYIGMPQCFRSELMGLPICATGALGAWHNMTHHSQRDGNTQHGNCIKVFQIHSASYCTGNIRQRTFLKLLSHSFFRIRGASGYS